MKVIDVQEYRRPAAPQLITPAQNSADAGCWEDTDTCGRGFLDRAGCWQQANRWILRWLGCSRTQLYGRSFAEAMVDRTPLEPALSALCSGSVPSVAFECQLHTPDGPRWLAVTLLGLRDEHDTINTLAVTLLDIDHYKSTISQLQTLIDQTSLMLVLDAHGQICFANAAAETALGAAPQALIGRSLVEFVHSDDVAPLQACMQSFDHERCTRIWRLHADTQTWRDYEITATKLTEPVAGGTLLLNCYDVTEQRQLAAHYQHRALHDPLTGLPNRAFLLERLERTLTTVIARRGQCALLFLDLDHFKHINDSLGHAAGDELLIDVSRRLRTCVRPCDVVARLGGDEFTVLLPQIQRLRDAKRVARRIIKALQQPFFLHGQRVEINTSIGIACAPAHVATAEDLLQAADAAMYHVKEQGRGAYAVFHPEETYPLSHCALARSAYAAAQRWGWLPRSLRNLPLVRRWI